MHQIGKFNGGSWRARRLLAGAALCLGALLMAAGCSNTTPRDPTLGWTAEKLYAEAKEEMASGRWDRGRIFKRMRKEFGDDFDALLADLETWPYLIETPDYIAVHAGFLPDRPPARTCDEDLCTLRTWRNKAAGDRPGRPWFEDYTGDKLVVFGHWAALRGVVRPNAIGLDTGCVYGGLLTALELPSRRLRSVQARRVYEEIR